jgi:hypothetical protein
MLLRSGKTYEYSETYDWNFRYKFIRHAKALIDEFNSSPDKTYRIEKALELFRYYVENKEIFRIPKMKKLKDILFRKYSQLNNESINAAIKMYPKHSYMTRQNIPVFDKYRYTLSISNQLNDLYDDIYEISYMM